VLVTGGAGFIGSHLVDRLLADGHRVVALDDLSTGAHANLATAAANSSFCFEAGCVTDPVRVGPLVANADLVFHLAAAVGVKLIVEQPVRTIETNVRGTDTVLRAAAERGCPVVLASSSEVYGKGTALPFTEESDLVLGPPTRSRWGYACSKAIDEYLAFALRAEQGLPVTVARFFNTVGARQSGRYGMVLPAFLEQGLAGHDITVFGSGEQQRCFADVGEVVESLVRLAACEAARGEVFNVGSRCEISIRELAEKVREKTGGRSQIRTVPYEEAYGKGFEDLGRRVPSTDKLEAAIGFAPSLPIDRILDRLLGQGAG